MRRKKYSRWVCQRLVVTRSSSYAGITQVRCKRSVTGWPPSQPGCPELPQVTLTIPDFGILYNSHLVALPPVSAVKIPADVSQPGVCGVIPDDKREETWE
jgi:hypothetical protein